MLKKLLPVGTRSLLWGVHNVFWHPWTVYRAWVRLYGRPTWREVICIIIHDWGYWGSPNMDGEEGTAHPELGARIAKRLLGAEYGELVLFHSRHYVKLENKRQHYAAEALRILEDIDANWAEVKPSRLCWADKLSILYDPKPYYLLRAWLSGELREYRANAAAAGFVPLSASDAEWFDWIRGYLIKLAESMDPTVVPYMPNGQSEERDAIGTSSTN